MTLLDLGKKLLCEITEAGYEAYIVGGAVRDIAMGKTDIHDVDIATNMPIEIIKQMYHTVEYGGGEKHGTVIVVYNGTSFELTQFRCDGNYTDGRRPDSVIFVNDFKTDCSRRDFTINAMGMNSSGSIVDFFDGTADIQSGIIKTVGNAHDRFKEDALRMIRAFRFAARLGFEVDSEIFKAIFELKYNIKNVSKERVRDEFEKTISYGGIAFAKFIHLMHLSGLLKVLFKDASWNIANKEKAIERANSTDVNSNFSIIFFGESERIKYDMKLSNETADAIKFVYDNLDKYCTLRSLSATIGYELCSHKHFHILRTACKGFFKRDCMSDDDINHFLKLKPMYDKQTVVSEAMLKHIKPSKSFGLIKKNILETLLQKFQDDDKVMSDEEIHCFVDEEMTEWVVTK
jgi:tRNA nucleotidyltransferase/poly(A) polymerase